MDSPVKTCKSTGDPHFTTFNGIKFDYHALGWNLLYEKADLKVETYHVALPNGSTIAINHAVKVTYKGNVYDFVDGTKPPGDEYFDETGDEMIFPADPVAKVTVTSRYFFRDQYIHNVFVTTANTAPPATGLCVDETEEAQAAVAADATTVAEFDPNGVTQEQAELECANIDDPEIFEECVFDLRIATAAVAAEGEASPIEVARSFVVAAEDTNTIERTLEVVAEEEAREEIAIESGFVADPLIVGLNRQGEKSRPPTRSECIIYPTTMYQHNLILIFSCFLAAFLLYQFSSLMVEVMPGMQIWQQAKCNGTCALRSSRNVHSRKICL